MGSWWMMVALAWAADPAPDEGPSDGAPPAAPEHEASAPASEPPDAPLAVPVGAEPPASARPRPRPPAPAGPLALPGQRVDVDALRAYRREHLSVRGYHEVWVGSTTTTSGFYGGRWGAWGGWAWTTPYVVEVDRWAILQGSQRLTVPEALERLGDPGARMELERSIRRKRTAGTVWYALGGASLAASIVGLFGVDQARSYEELYAWRAVSTAGMVGGVVGFVAGSFPLGRSRSLAIDPGLTLDRADAERRADEANARLAAELGLSPEQALRLETEARRRD